MGRVIYHIEDLSIVNRIFKSFETNSVFRKSLLNLLIFRLFLSDYGDENYQSRLKADNFTKRQALFSASLLSNFERVKQVVSTNYRKIGHLV